MYQIIVSSEQAAEVTHSDFGLHTGHGTITLTYAVEPQPERTKGGYLFDGKWFGKGERAVPRLHAAILARWWTEEMGNSVERVAEQVGAAADPVSMFMDAFVSVRQPVPGPVELMGPPPDDDYIGPATLVSAVVEQKDDYTGMTICEGMAPPKPRTLFVIRIVLKESTP